MNDGDRTRDHRNHNPGLYQLSYVHHRNLLLLPLFSLAVFTPMMLNGALGRTRTCYPRLRRPMLYPDELRALKALIGPHLNFKMVGAEGFEPPTLWSQTRCATRLRYAPKFLILCSKKEVYDRS